MSPVHAVAADLDAVGSVLGAAFREDPVQQWVFAPAADPDGARDRFFRFIAGEYFALGHTYVLGADRAAALWAPPDRHILESDDRIGVLLELVTADLGDETMPRLGQLARTAEFYPDEPHFYLGVLGVAPDHQSNGLGAALLAPMLAECDRSGFVAHLESSNPRNVPFYARHGFEVVEEFRIGDDDGPLMTVMTRDPR